MIRLAGVTVAMALALARPAAAQTPAIAIDPAAGSTIDQAIAEAIRAEPALGAARADARAARGEQQQARLRPNPEIMIEQREQAGGMDRQTSLSVDLPLDLFRRGARTATAARMVDAAEAALIERERQVGLAVRAQYGRALEAARRLEIADAVSAASRRTYELLRTRVDEGAAPPLERDAALLELRRMESARELAAGAVAIEAAALNRLLGRAPGAPVRLADSLETAVAPVAAVEPPASGERADVRAARADAAVAASQVDAARQESKPEIALFGGYMRMDSGFDQRGFNAAGVLEPIEGRFHNLAIGARIMVPIFDRGQGTLAAARARLDAANETLRARQLDVSAEQTAAAARVEAARRALAAFSAETRALAARNVDVVRETHALGRATLFDVLTEQRRYLEFESSYTDVLSELFAAETALRSATGDIR